MGKITLEAACVSDKGRVRASNEDNYYFNGSYLSENVNRPHTDYYVASMLPQYFAVFDGMGGEANGAEASQIAARLFQQSFHSPAMNLKKYKKFLPVYIVAANKKICERMAEVGNRMGTTMASLAIWRDSLHIANIGDSRIYNLHNGSLRQLSIDHTAVQAMVEKGVLTREQAASNPHRNQLSQHLGIAPTELTLEPYMASQDVAEDDVFLLCTDGLTDMVQENDISHELAKNARADEMALGLLNAALAAGGKDNITIIVVRVVSRR